MNIFSIVPKIIIFTETWLQPHIESHSMGLLGYNIFRCDRKSRAGDSARGGVYSLQCTSLSNPSWFFSLEGVVNRNKLDAGFVASINISASKFSLVSAYIPLFTHR